MARRYPIKDVKQLFALSAGRCAFPGCLVECIVDETAQDAAHNIGKIAHIEAHSDDGPRANPTLSEEQRDCYNNWILLCANCHDKVDGQPNTFTVADLKKWKRDHEKLVKDNLASSMTNVTFVELEFITNAIAQSTEIIPATDLSSIPIKDKMKRNDLSDEVGHHLRLGLMQAELVSNYISKAAQMQDDFPEKLKAGFLSEYDRLKAIGYSGDSLFFCLFDFAGGKHSEHIKRAAGLAVLAYLFQICEVFEK